MGGPLYLGAVCIIFKALGKKGGGGGESGLGLWNTKSPLHSTSRVVE
jgi:hypothetical protein